MNIQEAKQIRIADYLQNLGYTPVKQQGNSLWYKSPFRQETEASFKVNTDRNLWFDYGLGKGGNIIALAEVLYASDYRTSVPYPSLFVSKHLNRASNSWRLENLPIRHYSIICRNGV